MKSDVPPLLGLLVSAVALVGGIALTAGGAVYAFLLALGGAVLLVLCVRRLLASLREHRIRMLAPHDDLSEKPSS
ncbi:hypothetical protein [Schumannella sp. 10F1B-5-1]|uniref:hypothetical protein n=1 Tax=Schumannella sp. 10F1B-5-1 TaxID=2590780 RepID=UPI001130C296|nr:hypothetical protein [Schumannella sp. 10F1B-5-1]TPW71530.1 hypothetical protein FJ658_09170 [Schumannella sp. 10F1B-5-1]